MPSFHASRIVVDDDEFDTKFILSVHRDFELSHYMSNSKVTINSFAYEISMRIYEALFERSVCLNLDYDEYYSSEYESFEEYLDKKMLFQEDVVQEVLSFTNYHHYYIESRRLSDQLLIDGLFDDREISNPLSLFYYEN